MKQLLQSVLTSSDPAGFIYQEKPKNRVDTTSAQPPIKYEKPKKAGFEKTTEVENKEKDEEVAVQELETRFEELEREMISELYHILFEVKGKYAGISYPTDSEKESENNEKIEEFSKTQIGKELQKALTVVEKTIAAKNWDLEKVKSAICLISTEMIEELLQFAIDQIEMMKEKYLVYEKSEKDFKKYSTPYKGVVKLLESVTREK